MPEIAAYHFTQLHTYHNQSFSPETIVRRSLAMKCIVVAILIHCSIQTRATSLDLWHELTVVAISL